MGSLEGGFRCSDEYTRTSDECEEPSTRRATGRSLAHESGAEPAGEAGARLRIRAPAPSRAGGALEGKPHAVARGVGAADHGGQTADRHDRGGGLRRGDLRL